MADYIWKQRFNYPVNEKNVKDFSKKLNVPELIIKILFSRGISDIDSCRVFIDSDDCYFPDPFSLPDMREAVNRIRDAVDSKEKVYIFGDYDADGVTATVLLYKYLVGKNADVDYYIPSRFEEGYGLNKRFVEFAAEENTDLIITVDNGISAIDEISYANDLGIDTVVTDHHTCPDILPDSVANVNPKRKDSEYDNPFLAGVGVALKLCMALEMDFTGDFETSVRNIAREYSYLAAIGTIGDVMPLIGENRLIVKTGLRSFKERNIQGVLSLLQKSGSKITPSNLSSQALGFTVCPRINAAGRMGDIKPALSLFLSDDKNECDTSAALLCEYNSQRQEDEYNILSQADEMIMNDPEFDKRKVIVLSSPDWSSGIIGIVSSKITEKYNRPSILISEGPDGICKGSGRSIPSFDIISALSECGDCLIRFGGHKLAAGLTLSKDKISEFRDLINSLASDYVDVNSPVTVEYDIEVSSDDFSVSTADSISLLEPFGNGNPTPMFLGKDFIISKKIGIGDNKHTKFELSKNGVKYNAVFFSNSPDSIDFYEGDTVDILFNMNVNEFNNNRTLQFFIRNIRLAESFEKKYIDSDSELSEFINNKREISDNNLLVNRHELNIIYRYLRDNVFNGNKTLSVRKIIYDLTLDTFYGYFKIKTAIKIFSEISVLVIENAEGKTGNEIYTFSIPDNLNKTNLDNSTTFNLITGNNNGGNLRSTT